MTALKDEIGIFHAALAQLFLVLIVVIAVVLSIRWQRMRPLALAATQRLQTLWLAATLLIFLQLILGACMRHQHAGLAIPDFPLAYGTWWPDTSPEAILRYNQQRGEVRALNEITAAQVLMQMGHRILALAILGAVFGAAWSAWRALGRGHALAKGSMLWALLIAIQVILGAATIWTNKSADLATAHVAVGALSLVTGVWLILVGRRALVTLSSPRLAVEHARVEVAA